ncbi:MAG: butyrate kinase [Spirochaetaceae bacterium]|nr:butyrate kinase [Spirochaetaceae bacterium]
MKLLIINPGSTSTKIGLFEEDKELFSKNLQHDMAELAQFKELTDQYDFRKEAILNFLKETGVEAGELAAVVGRGGLVKPLAGGTYTINEAMKRDLHKGLQGIHASNLGGLIADEIAQTIGKPSFVVDPVVVDELDDVARLSGHPLLKRRSIFHALNQKAMARQYCREHNVKYTDVNLIVAHLGGGISVGIHHKGKVVDVNNALDGEGPFSPERSGGLPAGDLARLSFSGSYSLKEIQTMITGKGGMVAYFNNNNIRELEEQALAGNNEIKTAIDAMAYQVAKEIGAMAAVVNGKVDAIILTGGIAHSKYITGGITEKVKFIAPVVVQAGEDELRALAQGAVRVLKGEEEAKIY